MEYEELCKNTLELDPKIRFTGVVNNKGDLICGGNREGVPKLLSSDEVKMSVHYTMKRWSSAKNLSHKIGAERSSVVEYEKVTLITIPFNKNELFLMSTEPAVDYYKIINNTIKLIQNLQ